MISYLELLKEEIRDYFGIIMTGMMTLNNRKNRRTHRTGGEGFKEKGRERRSLGQQQEKGEMKTNPTGRKKTLKN